MDLIHICIGRCLSSKDIVIQKILEFKQLDFFFVDSRRQEKRIIERPVVIVIPFLQGLPFLVIPARDEGDTILAF